MFRQGVTLGDRVSHIDGVNKANMRCEMIASENGSSW